MLVVRDGADPGVKVRGGGGAEVIGKGQIQDQDWAWVWGQSKVQVLPGIRAETRSTQSGQVLSISHQGMLPPGWGPRRSPGGSGSLQKGEGSHYCFWPPSHTHHRRHHHSRSQDPDPPHTHTPFVLATGWASSSSSFSYNSDAAEKKRIARTSPAL